MISARILLALAAAALAAALASSAVAQGTVYRHVDADGKITYSDKPAPAGSAKVPNRVAPEPSAPAFDAAVNRGEAERLSYERQRAQDQAGRPVNIYDPRGGSADSRQPGAPAYPPGRRDYNLPDSPPPSSDRRYYYEGR